MHWTACASIQLLHLHKLWYPEHGSVGQLFVSAMYYIYNLDFARRCLLGLTTAAPSTRASVLGPCGSTTRTLDITDIGHNIAKGIRPYALCQPKGH